VARGATYLRVLLHLVVGVHSLLQVVERRLGKVGRRLQQQRGSATLDARGHSESESGGVKAPSDSQQGS
jgi:hypothetical protein